MRGEDTEGRRFLKRSLPVLAWRFRKAVTRISAVPQSADVVSHRHAPFLGTVDLGLQVFFLTFASVRLHDMLELDFDFHPSGDRVSNRRNMEIEGGDGSKTFLKPGSKLVWGRGSGFKSDDRTVSRRHVEFHLSFFAEARVGFLVIGKNPIWVHRRKSSKVSTFKTSESGEMEVGDMFCVSAKNPIWFACKRAELEATSKTDNEKGKLGLEDELAAESLKGGFQVRGFDGLVPEAVDISHIDPVKDFGFLMIGEEFNSYPKSMIKDVKNWNWFIEEHEEESEDDEFGEDKRKKKGKRRKRKKGGENEDEDWSGESEDEKKLITKARQVQRPKYSTRSKDHLKLVKDARRSARSIQKKATRTDDDEDDETLGGFIVDNDEVEEKGKNLVRRKRRNLMKRS